MKFLRGAIIVLTLLCFLDTALSQNTRFRVRGGRRVQNTSVVVDSLSRDSLSVDSLRVAIKDTVVVRSKDSLNVASNDSLVAIVDKSLLSQQITADSLGLSKKSKQSEENTKMAAAYVRKRFEITKDTVSPGTFFAMSLVPGLGQIYNRQWWKAPVFYAGIGAFVAGGIITSNQYSDYRNQFQHAVNMNQPREVTEPLQRKMQNAGSVRTVMYSLAAATYLYQVADATFKYRGYENPVRKSTILAAVFPGAGFIYTKTYWRIPIYYGGFIALATVVDYNNRNFQRYRDAYTALTDGDPTTIDEFRGRYSPEALKNVRDAYRRDRDFGIICMVGAYVLSIVDTYVIATLKNWDVSRDLAVRVEPKFFEDKSFYAGGGGLPSGAGLSLKLTF